MNELHGFRTLGRVGGAAVAALLILAGSAPGQSVRVAAASPAERPVDVDADVRARALEAQADALLGEPNPALLPIARLFDKAAAIRTASDPAQAEALYMAGLLYHHAGKLETSRQRLTEAADAFLAHGDVLKAARHLITAAHAAALEQRGDLVEPLLHRAECLLHSPLLNQSDVEEELRRIIRPGTAASDRK